MLLFTLTLFLLQPSNPKALVGASSETEKREQHPGLVKDPTGAHSVTNPLAGVSVRLTVLKPILIVFLLFTNRIPLAILLTCVGTFTSCVTEIKKTLWSRVLVAWVPYIFLGATGELFRP